MIESIPSGAPRDARIPWRFIAATGAVIAISLAHYFTDPAHATLHVVYQRLYYIPILFGAGFYGLRGGLALALIATILYYPHIVLHWGHDALYRANQLAEIVLFLVVGSLAGLLIDRVRREQDQHRQTAEELARAYEQLQETFERLRLLDSLSSLGALSVGMAHEIRNPLGSISGAIEILESSTPQGDSRREFVDILRKEIDRLSTIVSRQLDLARCTPHEQGPCDMEEMVRSVLELAGKQAQAQGVVPACKESSVGTIQADEQRLRQAVLNLVLNSIQSMSKGGDLVVSCGRDQKQDQEQAWIVVEDDGPGFTPEALESGLKPFYTTREGGTGLGLSIAFQVADQHGGDLVIGNRAEGGARVKITIPAQGVAGR